MRHLRLITILLCAVMMDSCLTRAPRTTDEPVADVTSERLMPYPVEVTWSALAEVFSSRTWTVATQDEGTRFITSTQFELPGGAVYCACGSGRRSTTRDCRAELRVQLKRVSANGTRVTIESQLQALDTDLRDPDWMPCSSSGQLETELFAAIDSVVVARGM